MEGVAVRRNSYGNVRHAPTSPHLGDKVHEESCGIQITTETTFCNG